MDSHIICCVPGCGNRLNSNRNVPFYRCPKNKKVKEIWLKLINKGSKTKVISSDLPADGRICAIHVDFWVKKDKPEYCYHKHIERKELDTYYVFDEMEIGEVTIGTRHDILYKINCRSKTEPEEELLNDHSYCKKMPEPDLDKELLQKEIEKLQGQIKQLQCEVAELKVQNRTLKQESEDRDTFSCLENERRLLFYTGFETKELFNNFLTIITPAYKFNLKKYVLGRPHLLNIREELFMVLSRLRLGLLEEDIAYRHNVSKLTVQKIWSFWMDLLSSHLPEICTDIFLDEPNANFCVNNDMKDPPVAKALLGITPKGYVTFVSEIFPARLTEHEIIEKTGLLHLLKPTDEGFIVKVPEAQNQFVCDSVEETKKEIQVSVDHMKRILSCLKTFKYLKYLYTYSSIQLPPVKVTQVWKVCCFLTNFTNERYLVM